MRRHIAFSFLVQAQETKPSLRMERNSLNLEFSYFVSRICLDDEEDLYDKCSIAFASSHSLFVAMLDV